MSKNDIRKRERELYFKSKGLKDMYMEEGKKGNKEKSYKLRQEELKIYDRQQFFKKMIREMEKEK